jgi:hypothetical protein
LILANGSELVVAGNGAGNIAELAAATLAADSIFLTWNSALAAFSNFDGNNDRPKSMTKK